MNSRRLAPALMILTASLQTLQPAPVAAAQIFPPGATLERLWNDGEFTEGAAAGPDGRIYFSDIPKSPDQPGRVLVFDPKTKQTRVHCADSGKSNGLMFDRQGRLLATCGANGGRMALCEILPDGGVRELVGRFNGKRFQAPNDLVIAPDGIIYFSDPRYIGPEPVELDQMSVYRHDPATGRTTRLTDEKTIQKPNGVHLSPDARTLYVAETNNGSKGGPDAPKEPVVGRMTLNAFLLRPDGTLGPKRVLASFGNETGTDGMAIDLEGNIYAAVRQNSRPGVVVFSPAGKELGYLPTKELPTNCCFGTGREAAMLYVTVGTGLYRIQLKIPGYHPAIAKR